VVAIGKRKNMNTRIPIRIHRKGTARLAPQPKQDKTFTAETLSSQSSEYIFIKQIFTPRPLRLGGATSEPCFITNGIIVSGYVEKL
jgi:hypothetical protein